jgi:hypothetical protein
MSPSDPDGTANTPIPVPLRSLDRHERDDLAGTTFVTPARG